MLSERIGGPGVFTDFAKEKEMLLALGVDGISVCFEVEFVVDCCPKVSICVNPLYRLVVKSQSGEGGGGLISIRPPY